MVLQYSFFFKKKSYPSKFGVEALVFRVYKAWGLGFKVTCCPAFQALKCLQH